MKCGVIWVTELLQAKDSFPLKHLRLPVLMTDPDVSLALGVSFA